MPATNKTAVDAAVQAHTPTPWGFGDLEKGSKRPMWEHVVDSHGTQICTVMQSVIRGCQVIGPDTQEEAKANAAYIVRACNAHAGLVSERDACRQTMASLERGQDELVKQNAGLVSALDSIEAGVVNLHCALQSTAHMDPADRRIPVITGQVVKDLLVLRDQARLALQSARAPQP